MSEAPDKIDLRRHRDLAGRGRAVWYRRGVILILAAIPILALANVFGQHPTASLASSRIATLSVDFPAHLRSGLIYQARISVDAPTALNDAHLVLSSGWIEGITVNTIEPSVSNETSTPGGLELSLGRIPAGHRFVLFMQFQVNPTTLGQRSADLTLSNNTTPLLSIHRTLTIFP